MVENDYPIHDLPHARLSLIVLSQRYYNALVRREDAEAIASRIYGRWPELKLMKVEFNMSRKVDLVIARDRVVDAWGLLNPIKENSEGTLTDLELTDVDAALEACARAEDSLNALIAAEVPADGEVRKLTEFVALFHDSEVLSTYNATSPTLAWAHASNLITKTEVLVSGNVKVFVWTLTPNGIRRVRELSR